MQDKKYKTFFQYHVPFEPKEDYKKYHVSLELYFTSEKSFFTETDEFLDAGALVKLQEDYDSGKLKHIFEQKPSEEYLILKRLISNQKILINLVDNPILKYENITEEQEQIIENFGGIIGNWKDKTIILFHRNSKESNLLIDYSKFYLDNNYRHSLQSDVFICYPTSINHEKCSFYYIHYFENRELKYHITHDYIKLYPTNEDLQTDVLDTCASLPHDEIELFFEHHFTWFEGETKDFLDYAEKLFFKKGSAKFIGGEQKYYLIIANWIKNKREESNYLELIANTVISKENITPQQTLSIEPSHRAEDTTGVQPPQSKNKAVTGFDLGFTAEQLTSLYKTLVDEKFLDRKTKLEHFKNAFNGEELKENFKPIKWIKSYYASIFVTHHTEYKTRWLVAETIFDNGNADSLKNGYKEGSLLLSDNQIKCVQLLNSIMKSLQ